MPAVSHRGDTANSEQDLHQRILRFVHGMPACSRRPSDPRNLPDSPPILPHIPFPPSPTVLTLPHANWPQPTEPEDRPEFMVTACRDVVQYPVCTLWYREGCTGFFLEYFVAPAFFFV